MPTNPKKFSVDSDNPRVDIAQVRQQTMDVENQLSLQRITINSQQQEIEIQYSEKENLLGEKEQLEN